MADKIFRGDALDVAQLETITVGGTWAAGETATITINGKDATHTVVSGSTAISDVVAGLIAAIAASTAGEFTELTWVDADPDITATGNTAGVPHTISVSETAAAGTISTTTTTAASGRNHLIASNVSGGLPAATDLLVLEQTSENLSYGLDGITGVAIAELRIMNSYTGQVGLRMRNSTSSPDYFEYRARKLLTTAGLISIGEGEGDGSGLLLIDCEGTNVNIAVLNTATSSQVGQSACRISNTGATSTIEISGNSSVALGAEVGDSCQFSDIDCSESARVFIGSETVVTELRISGNATVDLDNLAANADITLIELRDNAELILRGDNNITTLNIHGEARVQDLGTGTITNMNRGPTAEYTNDDTVAEPGQRIITNATLEAGTGILRTRGVTYTNGINLGRASLPDHPNLDPDYDFTISLS